MDRFDHHVKQMNNQVYHLLILLLQGINQVFIFIGKIFIHLVSNLDLFIKSMIIFFYGQLANDDSGIVYQLRIEQLPNHIELNSVDLSPVRLFI
jgi:hypothetical protein